jgi:hypothetical protein
MTIVALPEPTITKPAETLRRLADALDALPHARISPPDVFAALREVPAGPERQAALNRLHRHLRHAPGFEQWLYHWTGPQSRVEVVALVRKAAEQAAQVTR